VRLDEGNHDAAMAAFLEAHARSTALHERAPDNGQRLFDLAQAEYWIGFVAWQQGRFDDAGVWLRKYRDSAIRLAAIDRNNFAWQQEVAYGHHNLAVLDESRGRYAEAEQAMGKALAMRRAWSQARPQDTDVRSSVANTMSWLGSLSAQQGKLKDAERLFVEEVDAVSRNVKVEPMRAEWKHERAEALLLLTQVQAQRGRLVEARASVDAAQLIAAALVQQDSSNNIWQITSGICRWWQAQLAVAMNDSVAASALATQAADVFARAYASEPKNERLLGWLAKARHLQAQLALVNGDTDAARTRLVESAALIKPGEQNDPDESSRQLRAQGLVLTGETAQLYGDEEAARASWQEAEQLLLAGSGAQLPFDRLEPLVRTLQHLGKSEQARLHQHRLAAAGYVPLRPWPVPPVSVATQSTASTR